MFINCDGCWCDDRDEWMKMTSLRYGSWFIRARPAPWLAEVETKSRRCVRFAADVYSLLPVDYGNLMPVQSALMNGSFSVIWSRTVKANEWTFLNWKSVIIVDDTWAVLLMTDGTWWHLYVCMSYSILLQSKDDRLCHVDSTRDGPGSSRVGWVLFLSGCRKRPLVLLPRDAL